MKWFYSSLKNRFYISILALVAFSLVVIGISTFNFFKGQNSQYHLKRIQRKERTVTSSLQYFLNELKAFPNGNHDDQVDVLVMAIDKNTNRRKKVRAMA